MQDKTSNHAPIPTELNIAPRGKSWLHGQLIDGEQGHPTRQSMESADRAQAIEAAPAQAAPAAVAVPDGAMGLLEALESMVDVCEGRDFDGAPSDAHMEKARAAISAYRAALAATPAAAVPVVLPEPVAYSLGLAKYAHSSNIIAANEFTPDTEHADEWENLYTEHQVRALLAGVSAPAAQAVTAPTAQDSCCAWSVWWTHDKAKHTTMRQASIAAWDAAIAYVIEHAPPQAQADARDADDAALIEWLSGQYLAADFHWGDPKTPVLVIEIPPTASVCGDFRTDVRGAIAAQAAQQGGDKQ